MLKAPIPQDEDQRLKELLQFEILDTDAESAFDDLTFLASEICQSNISLISLIDKDRQWFKSKLGLDAAETPRDISWCGHAIMGNEVFEIPDAGLDERFVDNPLYLGEPKVRFYAGAPLITQNGYKIGTLCVIDSAVKKLSDWQKNALQKLAKQATILIESRLREKNLKEANAKLDVIVNNIPIMLSSFDEEGNFEWVNNAWTVELGWNLAEMSSRDMMAEFYPDPQERAYVLKYMGHPENKWQEFYTRRKDGYSIYTSWRNVKLPNGKSIGIGQNIHEKKITEENLKIQLKISQQNAKLASLGQLAAGVGHEINNPLAIMKGYLHAIEEDLRTDAPKIEQNLYLIKKINTASDRIVNIVKALRTFSRSESDQLAEFSMHEAIEESFNLVNDIYQGEGIDLKLNLSNSEDLKILGNRGRISQVILNLLSNAKDATEGQEERKVELNLSKVNGLVRITVQDNGKGIPIEIKERIFDPFFTTKDVNKGTGIGLSIVSSIVKEHEGEISFVSSDKGSTFIINIPWHQPLLPNIEAPKKSKPQTAKNILLKVLVADDEEDLGSIINLMLTKIGIEVKVVKNGKDALEAYLSGSYDLVLADFKMPVMNGMTLIKTIRSYPNIQQPKIILMTGDYDSQSDTAPGSELLIDSILNKPFNVNQLYESVQKLFPDKAWK